MKEKSDRLGSVLVRPNQQGGFGRTVVGPSGPLLFLVDCLLKLFQGKSYYGI